MVEKGFNCMEKGGMYKEVNGIRIRDISLTRNYWMNMREDEGRVIVFYYPDLESPGLVSAIREFQADALMEFVEDSDAQVALARGRFIDGTAYSLTRRGLEAAYAHAVALRGG